MRRLCSLLGMPQNRFASIHVVGTNGKTSVARMSAALLEAQGIRAGAYLSPHITSWRERIMIAGEPIPEADFESVLERVEQSAQVADRSAGEEGPVTQFELVTAAAFVAFGDARVQVAAIEAGLGGRLDATNVIPSKVTVLTSVGLDHTEWLGETLEEIAAEKLEVLRDHTTLITGDLPKEVTPLVDREAELRHARKLWAVSVANNLVPGYQAKNLALAQAAVHEMVGDIAAEAKGAAPLLLEITKSVPGRAEIVGSDPLQIFDAAHNADGARALAAALPDLAGGRDVVCCLAILAEKDATEIVAGLAPVCSRFVCTQIPEEAIRGSGRPVADSHSAAELAEICRAAGAEADAVEDPIDAWRRARELARERDGAALATGSHYLLSCIWTERPAPNF